jgi:predicted NACHT family NTPase
MVKRSIQASPTGIQLAKRGFAIKGWTQENLAGEVNLKTRQPIWRFFTGQSVDRQIFIEICSVLDLDWREIALDPPAEFPGMSKIAEISPLDIDGLVQQVKSHRCAAMQAQCGCVHLPEIARPIGIEQIYVDLYLTDRIASQQWRTISDLQTSDVAEFSQPTEIDSERYYRIGSIDRPANPEPATNPQIASLQTVATYAKLRVLGQIGSGKTTLLQHLAIECARGNSGTMGIGVTASAARVPILLALRDFAEESQADGKFSLLNYLQQRFFSTELLDPSMLETLLQAGRVLLLLDGMDEVLERDSAAVMREIRRFSEKYHQNQFVVTCRTAARKRQLHGFTDVEIAPLTPAQIASFADKWLGAVAHSNPLVVRKLDLPENRQFRQSIATPLFLHLACSIFNGQHDAPDRQLAFYKQGLDLLLGKWDEAKGIDRQNLPSSLSLPQKLRLLSQLATVTFEQGRYSIDRRALEQYIADYLQSLPAIDWEPEELQLESEAILDTLTTADGILIERSQGIFAFAYLAVQTYFTARKIVTERDPQGLAAALTRLVAHLTEPSWREVFLLVATMLRSADLLVQLMKQQIDRLIDRDPYVQEFLQWTNQMSPLVPTSGKVSPTRVFQLAVVQPAHRRVGVAASEHRRPNPLTNIHPVWQFSSEQQQLLQTYYASNQLLLDCLDRNPQVTIALRQDIEASLMRPPTEPNNRSWQSDYRDARAVGDRLPLDCTEQFHQRLSIKN